MPVKKMVLLLLILLGAAMLNGCWSRHEIEDLGIVTAVGFDKVKVDGREKWLVSALIIRPGPTGAKQQGGQQSTEAVWLVSALGDTLIDAGRNLTARSPRIIFLSHVAVVIVGEKLAREGIEQVTDFLLRDPRFRLRSNILIAKGQASDVLQAQPEMERSTARELLGMIATSPLVSKAYTTTIKDFILQLISPGRDAVASKIEVFQPREQPAGATGEQPGVSPKPPQTFRLTGAAVFRGSELSGWLADRETRGLLYVINKAKVGVIPIKLHRHLVPDVSFLMTGARSTITPQVWNDQIVSFAILIKAEGNLGEHEMTEQIATPAKLAEVEAKVAQEIKAMVEDSIRQAQQELMADIFGLGEVLHRKHPKLWKELKKNWKAIFPTVEVTVTVEAKIRRTGEIGSSPVYP